MAIVFRMCGTIISLISIFILAETALSAQEDVGPPVSTWTENVQFSSSGLTLDGLLTVPVDRATKGIVVIVHGYGPTNVVERGAYSGLRRAFASRGFGTLVWDKPGRGRSEGTFDRNQSVESSAQEVLDAANYLQSRGIPGTDFIGLWGIS